MAKISGSVVTLRAFGDNLVPAEITALLRAEPDDARTKGDRLVGSQTGIVRIAKRGMWRIDTPSREPEDLDAQVQEILDRLTNNLDVWADLARRFDLDCSAACS